MSINRYGLDSDYLRKNLELLIAKIDNLTPHEMILSLKRLGAACSNSFARCAKCDGCNTHYLQHDASRWYCLDCNEKYSCEQAVKRNKERHTLAGTAHLAKSCTYRIIITAGTE